MSLTPEQVESVQKVLVKSGCMIGTPSKSWTAPAMEGLKQYQISLGINYPACTLMPDNFSVLSAEMREAVEGKPVPKVIEEVTTEDPIVNPGPESEMVLDKEPKKDIITPASLVSSVKVDTAMRFPKKRR